MPFTDLSRYRGLQFRPLSKVAFFIFLGNFLILMELGAKHVESPFIEFGQISTVLYFAHFLIIVPFLSLLENSLIELECRALQDDRKLHANNFIPGLAVSSILNKITNIIIFTPLKSKSAPKMSYGYVHDLYYKAGASCFCCDLENLFLNKVILKLFATVVAFIALYTLYLHVNIITALYSIFQLEHCDAPRPWGIYFQDSATPQMEGLVELHDNILFYLVIILFGVGWILISTVRSYTSKPASISHKYLNHGKFVPIQECFKFNNIYSTSKITLPYVHVLLYRLALLIVNIAILIYLILLYAYY